MDKLKVLLGFDPKTMKVKTELVAGMTTFLTMCYILAVNPTILATTGMDKGALFTSTAIASAIATLLLAFMAKLPFAQAPSTGIERLLRLHPLPGNGAISGSRHWQYSSSKVSSSSPSPSSISATRYWSVLPTNLRYAISAGIGMFIAFIGLKDANIIVASDATFVKLGNFTPVCILGLISIMLSGVLMARRVKGSLFIAIMAFIYLGGYSYGSD